MTIAKALEHIDVTDDDRRAFERVLDAPSTTGEGFLGSAVAAGVALTPGVWMLYCSIILQTWDEGGASHAKWLDGLRRLYRPDDDVDDETPRVWADRLLDSVATILEALACPPDDDTTADLAHAFETLGGLCEELGDTDLAYDLFSGVLTLELPHGPYRRRLAERALRLAETAGRTHQIAVCMADIAVSAVAMAETNLATRLDAFDTVELAVERAAQAPARVAKVVAHGLHKLVTPHDWLRCLLPPLIFIIGSDEARKQLAEIVGGDNWPSRASAQPSETWLARMGGLFQAMIWEMEVEQRRFALEPRPEASSAVADWVSWTLNYPPYARAVPHSRSFQRETRFRQNVLLLMHELTHVFSFLGQVGLALTVLRVATLENELTMWSGAGGQEAKPADKLAPVPLPVGNGSLLWRAERGVELTRKAHLLQDAWTPWFEGLAVLAEVAADPMLDPVTINPMTGALRGLVDFHPKPGPDGIFDDKADIVAQFEVFAAQFEQACSEAISAVGPDRLYAYFRNEKVPYFAGYLAVRSVMTAWRQTTGRALTATECMTLLLHATRFGSGETIPDLSLRADTFAEECNSLMVGWVKRLASLPKAAIEDFLMPPEKSGPGRSYIWRSGKPVRVVLDDATVRAEQEAIVRSRLEQAMASLTRPQDAERLAGADPICLDLVRACDTVLPGHARDPDTREMLETQVRTVEHLFTVGSLFPLGRVEARFYSNGDAVGQQGYLLVQLRTTEDHVDTQKPSVNGFGFPITFSESAAIAAQYQLRGKPRMAVTRLIDLGGIAWPGRRVTDTHLLAFSYGDWLHVRGPNQAVDKVIREDPEHFKSLLDLVRVRLLPDEMQAAELSLIAPGQAGAQRTLEWIGTSAAWDVDGKVLPLGDWAALIERGAAAVLNDDARQLGQFEASRVLLCGLWDDTPLANACAQPDGFGHLTRKMAPERDTISSALLRTARVCGADEWLDVHSERVAVGGLRIFARTPLGWDVRAPA